MLLYLAQFDENRHIVALATEAHAKIMKAQYDRSVTPRNFLEGDLVLIYDPYIFKQQLAKGAYELIDFDGVSLSKPEMDFI